MLLNSTIISGTSDVPLIAIGLTSPFDRSSPFPSQWSSTGVQAIFDPAANLTTASTPTASSVVTSSVPLPSRSHHLKPDAIAGVAVGCFSLLLLSSLGAYFIMNQKRRKASSALARDPQYKIYPELSGSDGAVEIFTPLSPLDLLREFKLVELGASKNPEQDVATRRFYAELPAAGATKAT